MPTEVGRPLSRREAPPQREPHAVERKAQSRLADSPYYSLKQIFCEYHEGVLTLRGEVGSYYLKQLAQEMLLRLDQVEELVNHIEVRAV
jgi:osmotically-inducible protein OsmY